MKINKFFRKIMGDFEEDDYNFDDYKNNSSTSNKNDAYTQYVDPVEEELENINRYENYEADSDGLNLLRDSQPTALNVDIELYEDTTHVYIKAFLPSVEEENLFIDISRDIVTVSGKRENFHIVEDDAYFAQELTWGEFYREISLPKEIDIDSSNAKLEKGILFIKMKKTDKYRKRKLVANKNGSDSDSYSSKYNKKKYGKYKR